jgi:hypothetical protein
MFCEGMNNAKLGVHDQSYLFFSSLGTTWGAVVENQRVELNLQYS